MVLSEDLRAKLSRCLPVGHGFHFYHVSTAPTLTCALYTPPRGCPPEKTYCESHLLLLSQNVKRETASYSIALFALEIHIYTTAQLTTVFISKADSTGFAFALPSTGFSILRAITRHFISDLIRSRHRPDRRLVITLFARAQDQYLFPGSAENQSKHILNDRQLVRWWCRTLDPVLREYSVELGDCGTSPEILSKAYLIVPGHDARETRSFYPSTVSADTSDLPRWHNAHPLNAIAPYDAHSTAPRSLIPHFPDDPKSRFLLDLDDEIADAPATQSQGHEEHESSQQPSPSKRGAGMWKSVKSIEQFWEMMAFRQECASGRLVGFLWMTFTPRNLVGVPSAEHGTSCGDLASPSLRPAKRKREAEAGAETSIEKKKKRKKQSLGRKNTRRLQDIIVSREPRVKTAASLQQRVPEKTEDFYWPLSRRGDLVVSEKAYDRIHEILLRLDFAGYDTARDSTMKWVRETAIIAGRKPHENWGVSIPGAADVTDPIPPTATGKSDEMPNAHSPSEALNSQIETLTARAPAVNKLDHNFVRKKSKTVPDSAEKVNILRSGMIRKKSKV
ncbi:MAG: hypothetical protein Q9162_000351 [Coniocarpon cinnabarinum]